jgi:hypothetical protein
MLRFVGLILMIASTLFGQEHQKTLDQPEHDAIWATISVPSPVLVEGHTGDLQIFFSIVNDGDVAIKPMARRPTF